MKSAKDHKPLSQFSLLLQGPPKTGKTTLALQFPKPYLLDCDNNAEGSMRWMKQADKPIDFFFDVPDVLDNGTERPIRERYVHSCKCLSEAAASPNVETIIVDGVSKLSSYIMADIGRQQSRKDGEMQLQDWGFYDYMWRNFVTKMQACPKMFILIAHEEFSDVPQLAGHILINMAGKKIQQALPGMFSDVWRCEVETPLNQPIKRTIRASAKTGLSLGNSLGLPDTFPSDYSVIAKALAR